MFKNLLKVAIRNLVRHPRFSLLNISGLAIGMACTLLIAIWVYNERSWDRQHANYASIYHVLCNRDFNGEIQTGPDMMYPLPKAIKAALPEVERAALVSFGEQTIFTNGDKHLRKNTITVSPDFFSIFSYATRHGNAVAAVADPNAVVLTESAARSIFGHTDVINQPLTLNNGRQVFVKAVVADPARNATLQFDAVIPFNTNAREVIEQEDEWVNCGNRVFLQARPGTDVALLEKKILQLVRERTERENPTTRGSIILHPMSKWRLWADFSNGVNTGGRIEYVQLFTWIALIILVIACINFMNLSTARSERRAREVGIRKTLGSRRGQLLAQFMAESLVLSAVSFLIACGLVYLIRPAFANLLNEDLRIPLAQPLSWILALGVVVFTGLLAGSYPALYLSGFRPVKVLKGTFLPGRQALLPRKILVTAQFIVSIVFISATLIVYQQLRHARSRSLGYSQNQLLMVNSSSNTDKSFAAFRNDLQQSGLVAEVNRTSGPITDILGSTSGIRWTGAPPSNNLVIGFLFTNEFFAKTLQARMLAGRDFQPGDSNRVLFNEAAIRVMGIKDPVGKTINWAGRDRQIIGVVGDMVMGSPYAPATPLMMVYEPRWSGRINLRIAPGADVQKALGLIEATYKKYSPETPFDFRFVDDAYNEKFLNEQLIGKLALVFAGLAIFICCLGLFGLVASSIERRKKEIGVRKVLGASLQSLLVLLSREFLLLVALAFLVAIPLAWWAMNRWLENYTYRISVGLGVFLLVGLITVIIALATIGLNASKAALGNPVRSLRNE